ncbi:MAG TPA: FkbM family methyltransferase, partial [Candidatus Saccharimonadales bacterium]|nr:FkbM family methyltransferase [Candidatus Saccharimonadales bacterium]
EGSLTLNLSPITVGTHTACELNVPGVTQIEVPVVTLDKFVSKEKLDVDLLKIDVEGYEGFVLQGAKDLIVKQKPTIFMEYLPDLMSRSDFDINDLRSLLFDHYKYCFVVDEMAQAITEIDVKGLDLTSFSGNIILTHKQKHTDFVRSQISAKG